MPTNVYDVNFPPDTQAANLLGQDIRDLTLDVQERMALISGITSSRWDPSTDAQPTNWTGLLFFATETGIIWQWSGSAWTNIGNFSFGAAGTGIKFFASQTAPVTTPATFTTIPGGVLKGGSVIQIAGQVDSEGSSMGWNLNLNGIIIPMMQQSLAANFRSLFTATLIINSNVGGNFGIYLNGIIYYFPVATPTSLGIAVISGSFSIGNSAPSYVFNLNSNAVAPAQVGPMSTVVYP